jgi:oligopeptide/dipeptide ABC transporter ATP-binding protein
MDAGTTREIFASPHHPYTRGLMAAIPRPSSRRQKMPAIPGSVPADPGSIVGCAFAPRCPFVFERCHGESPRLYELGTGHLSACFLSEAQEVTS